MDIYYLQIPLHLLQPKNQIFNFINSSSIEKIIGYYHL